MIDIKFNVPPYVDKAADYIQECVKNQKICGDGEYTKKCNAWIEERTGTGKCLLTTSCTHATELAALLCDIRPGDEVIMPSYTFVSTADAFVLRGAIPVFVDIRPDTMNIDETKIEEADITTAAILKVQQANADGIRFLKEAGADEAVLTMKSLEAFGMAADGKATKIIIPSEIQNLAGLAASLKDVVVDEKKTEE